MKLYFTQINPLSDAATAAVKEKGWLPHHHPFRKIVFHQVNIARDLEGVDVLVLTSKNAAKWLLKQPLNLGRIPFAVVGETSAELLSTLGLHLVTKPAATARELAADLSQKLPQAAKVLFLCGAKTTGDLERGLARTCLQSRVVYSTQRIALKNAAIDSESMVYFQAPSTVDDYFSSFPFRPRWVAAIGPTTRLALEQRSWRVDFQPKRPELKNFIKELPLAGRM